MDNCIVNWMFLFFCNSKRLFLVLSRGKALLEVNVTRLKTDRKQLLMTFYRLGGRIHPCNLSFSQSDNVDKVTIHQTLALHLRDSKFGHLKEIIQKTKNISKKQLKGGLALAHLFNWEW